MPNGDLPFADVSRESLAKLSNREVLQVHKRFDQSWRKREIMTVPLEGLNREDFLSRFAFVVAELKKRELDRPDAEALDAALARQNPKQESELSRRIDEQTPHKFPLTSVSPSFLATLGDRDIQHLHSRMSGDWRVHESGLALPENMNREKFVECFAFVVSEQKKRGFPRAPAGTDGSLDDMLIRLNPRREADQPPSPAPNQSEGQDLSEAFHLRDTHWVDVPESGACPMSHPTKARFPGKQKQVCFTKSAAESAAQARMREQDEPEQVEPEQVEPKQDDKPRSSRGLTVAETFAAIQEKGQKFTQDEANFQRVSPSPDKVCGACRFYLRSPTEAIGACQVVDGPIPWFATSDLYISATDEAVASFAAAQQIARATSPFNESDLFYGDADLTRASTDDEKADSGAREVQVEKGE
ncbi:hypothetical protein LCGC14_1189980 [marine sediment metagenome]|uniref:Uncharacterized protein n=1 Tax=marine sediment metagenome TaxID=412755 RepID=A0A0F9PQ40_9ZZZZ